MACFPDPAPNLGDLGRRPAPHLTDDALCEQVRKLHRRGYSDRQIQRWLEEEDNGVGLVLTLRQVAYWRRVALGLPSNGRRPRFDGADIRDRRDQNAVSRRLAVARLGWGHLLPDPPGYALAPGEPPRAVVFDLKPVEAVILSLLKETPRMTRREIVVALGKHRSRKPLYSDGTNYLRRLVAAGLVVEHRVVWNCRAAKAYSLSPDLPNHERTRRDDNIDKMLKKLGLSLY